MRMARFLKYGILKMSSIFPFLLGASISTCTQHKSAGKGSDVWRCQAREGPDGERAPSALTLSRKSSASSLPFTLAALRSSFSASSLLRCVRSQRADSGTNLQVTRPQDVTHGKGKQADVYAAADQ